MNRLEQQKTFISFDGTTIFYRYWSAKLPSEQKNIPTIILFHQDGEHSGRIAHLVDELGLPECQFFAWDARGNGHSEGVRGDAPNFASLVYDANQFVEHIKTEYHVTEQDIAIIAQSVGAVIASTWIHDYAPNIKALVLSSPAFKVKLHVPFAMPVLKFAYTLYGNFFVKSYAKEMLLTHDQERMASFNDDPLITRSISIRFLIDLLATSKRTVKDAFAIHVPTQLILSGSDHIVRYKPQQQFYKNLSSHKKALHILPDFYHDNLGEKDRRIALEKIAVFVKDCFTHPSAIPSLFESDKKGYTKEQADKLSQPEKNWLKKIYWKINRALIKYGGRHSPGIKLGLEMGFDSGISLDYIYQGQAHGETALSRLIDHYYLDNIGWRGVRLRKKHVEELMLLATKKLLEQHKAINILDIAAGHGRYILNVVGQMPQRINHILMRDFAQDNVQKGQELIEDKGLKDIASFELGDAFSLEQLATLPNDRTLAIVSGFYELFSDNTMVATSLAGIANSVEEGGYLIYTGQPLQPEREYMARVLTSHQGGKAWLLRQRTQLEIDQLVAAAGFEKITQRIDPWGIYTVSLAKRVTSAAGTKKNIK